jgi:hypothetical protein
VKEVKTRALMDDLSHGFFFVINHNRVVAPVCDVRQHNRISLVCITFQNAFMQ